MKIAVINGSPKGSHSITYQSVRYLQKHFPEVEFETFHVGQRIKAIGRDHKQLDIIIEAVRVSDCVLWCYPVYILMAPYQLVKFVDLIFEHHLEDAFAGKYASQISTSKHFYDHTASNYIHHISEDLGMKHWPGHSADMDDLTIAAGRERLLGFGKELVEAVNNAQPVPRKFAPVVASSRVYTPPPALPDVPKTSEHRVVLVTNCTEADTNLQRMIETYRKALPNELTVFNIAEFGFQGGCLGCFHCAFEGSCVYTDGFDVTHRQTVLNADCVILAASISHHSFGPIWKCYDDRQFYNGHRPSLMGKAVGYIVSGPLRQEANMREIMEARCEVGQLYLLDIVTDEYDQDESITSLLTNMAQKTIWAIETKPQRPVNFLGVGGMKVFRDLIYIMQGLMQEDHKFYKQRGLYDFPQQQYGKIIKSRLMGLLLQSRPVRKKASRYMLKGMLQQYNSIIERF